MVGGVVAILALMYFAGKFHKVSPTVDAKFKQHPKLDVLWTLVPIVMLMLMLWPASKLLLQHFYS